MSLMDIKSFLDHDADAVGGGSSSSLSGGVDAFVTWPDISSDLDFTLGSLSASDVVRCVVKWTCDGSASVYSAAASSGGSAGEAASPTAAGTVPFAEGNKRSASYKMAAAAAAAARTVSSSAAAAAASPPLDAAELAVMRGQRRVRVARAMRKLAKQIRLGQKVI